MNPNQDPIEPTHPVRAHPSRIGRWSTILLLACASLWMSAAAAEARGGDDAAPAVSIVPAVPVAAPAPPAPAAPVAPAALQQSEAGGIIVEGWVESVTMLEADRLRLGFLSARGAFEIEVDADTRIEAEGGEAMAMAEIAAGQRIELEGLVEAEAIVSAEAMTVFEAGEPAGEDTLVLRGRVRAAIEGAAPSGQGHLLVLASPEGERIVEVAAETEIRSGEGDPLVFSELVVGAALEVSGTGQAGLGLRAERIELLAGVRPARLRVEGLLRAMGPAGEGERWIVGQTAVFVAADLEGAGEAQVGQRVEAEAGLDASGQLELQTLSLTLQLVERIELRGTLEVMSDAQIVVDGQALVVDAGLQIEGDPEVGDFVEVEARIDASGEIRAELLAEVELEVRVDFEGSIESLGLTRWVVDGVEVQVDLLTTVIVGLPAAVGLHAEVSGTVDEDGKVAATRINVLASLLGGLESLDGVLVTVTDVPGVWEIEVDQEAGLQRFELEVSEDTIIDESRGSAQVGARARVLVERVSDSPLRTELIRIR